MCENAREQNCYSDAINLNYRENILSHQFLKGLISAYESSGTQIDKFHREQQMARRTNYVIESFLLPRMRQDRNMNWKQLRVVI